MVLESPSDPNLQAEIDRQYQSLRVTLRPHGRKTKTLNGGHYRAAITSGLTTVLAAGDRILSLRWAEPDLACVIKKIDVAASLNTAFGAVQENAVDLVKLTGFTVADGGGTDVPLSGQFKMRREMTDSRIASLRVASATAVTGGTSTVDSIIGRVALGLANTVGAAAQGLLYTHTPGEDEPLTLMVNEGINARIGILQGAAGVVRFVFTIDWMEVPHELLAA